jgi:hypothetical protein
MKLQENSDIIITENDLPALFNAADRAAIEAKKNYLKLTISDLSLLVLGTFLLSIELHVNVEKFIAGFAAVACFIGSFVSTIMILKAQHEKIWYGARAVAETIKSLSWKYMTCSEPFTAKLSSLETDEEFISKLTKIISERRELFGAFNGAYGIESEITDMMRKVRNLDLEKRKQTYLEQRVNDQRKWYGHKAKQNKRHASRWFFAVLIAQSLAVLFTLLSMPWPGLKFLPLKINLAHVFSSAAIAFLAWIQVKQHQELAQSYGVAAYELGLIAEQISYIKTDEELCKFVSESENAISREHTMWIARRERAI